MNKGVFTSIGAVGVAKVTRTLLPVLGLFSLIFQACAVGPKLPVVGAARTEVYLPMLIGKGVGIVANPTSMVDQTHLVDTLVALGVDVKAVFAPEHGFRGDADAGEKVKDSRDVRTGLPIISLYGKNLKPNAEQLKGIEVIVFDIQDVGARFYTYISTMSHIMEACARYNIKFVVLDRPNPNGHYVDGPVLQPGFESFVGLHPVPVVHGLTIGEYARMVNGEGWLPDGIKCELNVVEMLNYARGMRYDLPVRPSPNLPNAKAVWLYPSLCFFEGTVVSEGRGTSKPFQQFGYPEMPNGNTKFTPQSLKGAAANPKFKDVECNGIDLSSMPDSELVNTHLNLLWLINAYRSYSGEKPFFDAKFFDKLAGTDQLRKQIVAGKSERDIRASWQPDLDKFSQIRLKYLILAYSP